MVTRLFSDLFGAGVRVAVKSHRPRAADDIEAKAQVCAACHGQNGVPTDPKTIPIIWGQQESYMVKQLRDYRNGDRDNPIMSLIAKGFARGRASQACGLFRRQALAGEQRPPLPLAAQRNSPVPALPSAQF